MSISSQLPPVVVSPNGLGIVSLAQAAGSTVEGKVLGQDADGTTQVQIGRQVLALRFPVPPSLGATLTLAVQQAEGQVRLALVSTTMPASDSAPARTPTPAQAPATNVQISADALSRPIANEGPPKSGPLPPAFSGNSAGVAAPVAQPSATTVLPAVGHQLPPASPAAAAARGQGEPVVAVDGRVSMQPAPGVAVVQTLEEPGPSVASPVSPAGLRLAVPYPLASPALPTVPSTPVKAIAGTVPAPVSAVAGAPALGQQPTSRGSIAPPLVVPQASPSQTPEAALAQMVQRALPQQDSILGLTVALTNVIGKIALPQPVVKAAQQVLAQRLMLDGAKLDGATLQRAVLSSGVFHEALVGAGLPKEAGGDLKAGLIGLQRSLGAWLGAQAPVERVASVPPPIRGMVPRARGGEMSGAVLPDVPEEAGKVLLERTDAALSRVRLHQNASLPDPAQVRQDGQWNLDIPVTIAGQQNVLQMQIHRDPDEAERPQELRGWQVRFAINLGQPGEVGAQISLRGKLAGVMIWADSAETARVLDASLGELREGLGNAGLHVGAILVRAGAPAAHAAPQSRHMLDEMR